MMEAPVIMWFRRDLRLADNPALVAAIESGQPLLPVFIWTPSDSAGAASRWWLHRSLAALDAALRALGSRLILRVAESADQALLAVIAESGAKQVVWNRQYEPGAIARDRALKLGLREAGLRVQSFNGSLMLEPQEVQTATGTPYQVFTPFWKRCRSLIVDWQPSPAPPALRSPQSWPKSALLETLELEPKIDWAAGFSRFWEPGESAAERQLTRFAESACADYDTGRDRPDLPGTSRLSPHLHFGELSPRQLWHAVRHADGCEAYRRQLGWRDFAHHLLVHFPHTAEDPLREKYAEMPWAEDPAALRAWQQGRTGYPIVDAGMRELWQTGWMHNRVRMIAGSFLVKDLLIPWQEGAAWFWDTLVDADLANNTMGWQWVAGCGADASPFFRIFNPVLQGQKFDPDAVYVRRYLPELARLPDRWIHRPWLAPDSVLAAAGVELGRDYPLPIVDHGEARKAALHAYHMLRT